MKVTCTLVVQQDDGYEKVHEIDPVSFEFNADFVDYRPNAAAAPSPARKVFIEGLLIRTTERKTKMPEEPKKKAEFYEGTGGEVHSFSTGQLAVTVHVDKLTTGDASRVMGAILNALNAVDWSAK